jgi:hypothetical protein
MYSGIVAGKKQEVLNLCEILVHFRLCNSVSCSSCFLVVMEKGSKGKMVYVPKNNISDFLVFDTSNFKKIEGESLKDAWYRIKDIHC